MKREDEAAAQALLERALERHATCASCEVRGETLGEFRQDDGTASRVVFEFAAACERPGRLLFEWGERNEQARRGREVVLHEQGATRSWPLGADGPVECSSLAAALANDAGGAAPLVGSLLLPEAMAGVARLGPRASAARREPLDGREAWRVELAGAEARQTAWFDAETLALRRFEDVQELGGIEVVRVTTLEVRFDGRLEEGAFALAAPRGEERLDGGFSPPAWAGPAATGVALAAAVLALARARRRRAEARRAR